MLVNREKEELLLVFNTIVSLFPTLSSFIYLLDGDTLICFLEYQTKASETGLRKNDSP